MRNWLAKITPDSWLLKKLFMLAVLGAACFGAFCWGRRQPLGAQQPGNQALDIPGIGRVSTQDYDRRIVAYLYQNEVITRAELGEYLIARFGPERLEFLINRKIVEMEGRKRNIFVTDAEVEDRFRQDLRSFGKNVPLTEKDFETQVLRRFNKTLYEWKEDVVRPKIMMEKIVKPMVKVTDQDVQDGFEARFGPKVECRMIVLEKGNSEVVHNVWLDARRGPDQFMEQARKQFIPNLAADGGRVPAIHKHFGDKNLEDAAFRLRPKEISEPITMPDKTSVILMCERLIPPDVTVKYTNEYLRIHREVEEMRIAQKIPEVFTEMRKFASPRPVLENAVNHVARVEPQTSPGLRAFDQVPSSEPSLPPTQPPVPTPLLVPAGYKSVDAPNTPLAPPVLPGFMPNLSNIEKK